MKLIPQNVEVEPDLITTLLWCDALDFENAKASIMVERDETDPARVVLHTYVDGRGSLISMEWDRDKAIDLAHALLAAVKVR